VTSALRSAWKYVEHELLDDEPDDEPLIQPASKIERTPVTTRQERRPAPAAQTQPSATFQRKSRYAVDPHRILAGANFRACEQNGTHLKSGEPGMLTNGSWDYDGPMVAFGELQVGYTGPSRAGTFNRAVRCALCRSRPRRAQGYSTRSLARSTTTAGRLAGLAHGLAVRVRVLVCARQSSTSGRSDLVSTRSER
jgi:hypothetical protein